MKTPEQILMAAKKEFAEATLAYGAERHKLKKALEDGNITEWARWSTQSLVLAEMMCAKWKGLVDNIQQGINKGLKSGDILSYLNGYRESIVESVMKSRSEQTCTNPVENVIRGIEQDADRKFAGTRMIDSGSLAELIFNSK